MSAGLRAERKLKVQGEAGKCPGTEVLDQDIALSDQPAEDGTSLLRFEIHDNAALVAVYAQVIGALPLRKRRAPGTGLVTFRRFHLDHICSEIAENHRTIRTSEHAAEIQNTDSM